MITAVYRANAGYLLRHPWQLALALLGICIGVAVMVAVDLANVSARKAFLLSMDAVTGAATHQLVGGPAGIDEQLYARLRVEQGLRTVAPVVEGTVYFEEVALQLLGVDLFAEEGMRGFTQRAGAGPAGDGRDAEVIFRGLLTKPGTALLSAASAASLGLSVGEEFTVSAGGRRFPATLLALLDDQGAAGLENLMVVDIATAQVWLDQVGRLSRIDVRFADGASSAMENLEGMLPDGVAMLTAAGRTRSTAEMSAAFMTNLTAMSLLALLVGLFLIYNSVSFSVLQRRPLIGVLRALGVTRREVFTMILVEAALSGLFASALGVVVGVWLGHQLLALVAQSINDFYFRVSVTDVAVSTAMLGKGLVAGLGATLVAAMVPAVEAASYQPRLAMTRSVLERQTHRLVPLIALIGIGVLVLAVLVLLVSGRNLVAGLTAVFMLILGFALCVPAAVRAATSVLAPLAKKVGGTQAGMAVSGIAASLSRTGVAIVALAVAVSATIGVSVMVDSFRTSVAAWLEQTLQADVYFGVQRGTLDPELFRALTALPGVEAYSTSRRAWIEDAAGRTRVLAVEMAPGSYAGTEILDGDPAAVWPAFESEDVVLVSEPYAYQKQVRRGESVRLRTDAGEQGFLVLAVYQSYDINASALLMSRATYDRHWNDRGVDAVGLFLRPGANPQEMVTLLEETSAGRQQLRISSNADIRDLSLAIFDRTFVITDILYWLALGVAIIGILGAMLALQLERSRELGVLRALGMTPAQLAGLITLQTGVIGLLSGLAAMPLGIIMAYVLIEVVNRRAFGWQIDMTVTPGILFSSLLFAVIAALLAGIYPALRAARSQPALAMREE